MGVGIEADYDVDVAVGMILATRHRAEDGQGPDARCPQLRLVGLECRHDAIACLHFAFFVTCTGITSADAWRRLA